MRMWMSVPGTRPSVVHTPSAPTSQENTIAPACLGFTHLNLGPLRNQRLSNVQILTSALVSALPMQHAPTPLGATFAPATPAMQQTTDSWTSQTKKWNVKILMSAFKIHHDVAPILSAPTSRALIAVAASWGFIPIQKALWTSPAKGFPSSVKKK